MYIILQVVSHWIHFQNNLQWNSESPTHVARNGNLGLIWRYYDSKGILWNIGKYSYFGLLSSCILSKDKLYRVETMDVMSRGKITLKKWFQFNIKYQ